MNEESVKIGIIVAYWVTLYALAITSDVEEKEPITRIVKDFWPHLLFLIVIAITAISV